MTATDDEAALLASIQAGDADTFASIAEAYRRQLHVHCYRILGSFDEAEDMVQETMLRAWRGWAGFEGRARFHTWLYRIATNVCLNALERSPRRVMPPDAVPAVTAATPSEEATATPPWRPELPWLEPYPDELLDLAAPSDTSPDSVAISRETIELTFLAALQHLPSRQRAVLVLSDVLGWSAREVAELLELTVASATSALQRASATPSQIKHKPIHKSQVYINLSRKDARSSCFVNLLQPLTRPAL
jgi:RNA polymerase sigma-70 factor (ECF subfamily)